MKNQNTIAYNSRFLFAILVDIISMLLCGILQLISMYSNTTKEKWFELLGENK